MAVIDNNTYVDILVQNTSLDSIGKVMQQYNIINITKTELFNLNKKSIFASYTWRDKKNFPTGSDGSGDYFVSIPFVLKVPSDNFDRASILLLKDFVNKQRDTNVFLELESNKLFNSFVQRFQQFFTKYTILLHSKTLSDLGNTNGKLINITKHVSNVTVNSGDNGANFSFDLASVNSIYSEFNQKWEKNKFEESNLIYKIRSKFINDKERLNDKEIIVNAESTEQPYLLNDFFYDKNISENDVVFIIFDDIKIDEDSEGFINPIKLKGINFDFIGLVDEVPIDVLPAAPSYTISVTGRDFSKVFIEDNTYIFPIQVAEIDVNNNNNSIFNNVKDEITTKSIGRLVNGQLFIFNNLVDNTLEDQFSFIINVYSHAQIVSDSLFTWVSNPTTSRSYRNIGDVKDKNFNKLIESPLPGIWKIIKLTIDKTVDTYRLVDPSLGIGEGSMMNFINKICDGMFVEQLMDTYNDSFHIVVRKKPITKDLYNKLTTASLKQSEVSKINSLSYNKEVYSWYRLTPQNYFINNSNQKIPFPAILFEEYAEIWGQKALDKSTNYVNFFQSVTEKKQKDSKTDDLFQRVKEDLRFLIEGHSYLPFTRKCTIELSNIRRDIKKGMRVYVELTNEYYIVDSVTHMASVSEESTDQYSILTLSRGMIKEFAEGLKITLTDKDGNFIEKEVSYFNIIDFSENGKPNDFFNIQWKVDPLIFDFFLKRRQFITRKK